MDVENDNYKEFKLFNMYSRLSHVYSMREIIYYNRSNRSSLK